MLVRRNPEHLRPDPARVITELFVPGQEGFDHLDSRSSAVLGRILALSEAEVRGSLDDVVARFGRRHRDLLATFRMNAHHLMDRLPRDAKLSKNRRLLIGAVFTNEKAIEGAGVCNPSIVAHPDQTGIPAGGLRFVMSLRGIGEGHRSSVEFRTGVVDAFGRATVEDHGPFATTGVRAPAELDATPFRVELDRLDGGGENADYIFDALGDRFSHSDLQRQLATLERKLVTRRHSGRTASLVRSVAERTYGIRFDSDSDLSERVLVPSMGAERQGMEDARFVRFTDDDGSVTYYGGYTAYDGHDICQQILRTDDFVEFTSSPVVGAAAANKGLALFPRRIGGRFAALSRADRESNAIAFSRNPYCWLTARPCQVPESAWEVLQLGNCGSPIETDVGWLVLTHGVGPLRTYNIGAILLDLDDPVRVLGRLRRPLLSPDLDEQNGYVPNVVYSCGALAHAGTLILPYGIGDSSIGIATVALTELLDALSHESR